MREVKEAQTSEARITCILDIKLRRPSSDAIRQLCEEVVSWQKEAKVRYIPRRYCKEDRERRLGIRLGQVLRRRFKAGGTKPHKAMLNDDDCVMINRIPGVIAEPDSEVLAWQKEAELVGAD
jgi:hypothetical protein